jgi:signal peptidase I
VSKSKPAEKSPQPDKASKDASSFMPSERAVRETVESIAIAFVLAFLFRTFEAEAFVIPTGSMAPTLQGMHKDVYCPECGYNYRAGASQDNPEETRGGGANPVTSSECPMCGFKRTDVEHETSYNGDRILVSKFAYDVAEPQRWDVFVFRYPGDAKINYIKRLVGLPNETLTIRHGDVFVRGEGETEQRIARKPPYKIRAMLQEVYDNRYIAKRLDDAGWPRRWFVQQAAAGGWVETTQRESTTVRALEPRGKPGEIRFVRVSKPLDQIRQSFECEGGAQPSRLAFQHFMPEEVNWGYLESHPQQPFKFRHDVLDPQSGQPYAIADYYAYNESAGRSVRDERRGPNWVGDFAVECDLTSIESGGELALQLAEGGVGFECRFNLKEQTATMSYARLNNEAVKLPFDVDIAKLDPAKRTAKTRLGGSKTSAKIMFANIDDQLLLWIDDELIEFDGPTTFADPGNHVVTDADQLRPIRLEAIGAKLRVDHLRVLRDVYYIATNSRSMEDQQGGVSVEIGPDQFFAMGDNSPASQDSRIWNLNPPNPSHTVDRRMLIGKALFIYWPHSLDYFPFCPNFPRMGFVR